MANYIVTDTELTSIANAIRAKTGNNEQIAFPSGFINEITSIGSTTPPSISLNTELVDFSTNINDYIINKYGEQTAEEWGCCTDYIIIDPSMTFTYHANYWYYIAFYSASKEWIRCIKVQDDATQSQDGNYGDGILSGSKIPSWARYIRLSAGYNATDSDGVSLIRTA